MLYEVCFHARGGQGAVLAAKLLILAASIEGLWGQAFPLFGGERRGAPVFSFARISDKPVRVRSRIRKPDALLVFDRTLLGGRLPELKEEGLAIVNSPSKPSLAAARVYWVDATAIAVKHGLMVAGWPAVNTAMLGAFAKASGIIGLESLVAAIKHTWTGELGEANAAAAEEAFRKVVGA